MPRLADILAAALSIAWCCAAGASCKQLPEEQAAPAPAASQAAQASPPAAGGDPQAAKEPAAPKATPPKSFQPLSAPCQELLAQIQALDKEIPALFRELKRSGDEINRDMISCIALCRRFVAECPETAPASEVKGTLARNLLARFARHEEELTAALRAEREARRLAPEEIKLQAEADKIEVEHSMQDYLREVEQLAAAAAGENAPKSNGRLTALRVIFDLHRKSSDTEGMTRLRKQILEEYPGHEGKSHFSLSIGEGYLYEGRYRDAVDYLRRAIDELQDEDPDLVIFYDKLFEALNGAGDLEGMEEILQVMRAEYPGRWASLPEGVHRTQFEQWYNIALFWQGFLRMAQGDMAEARKFFDQHVEEVASLSSKLAAEGKALNKVVEIFVNFRTRDMINWLEKYYGKVPPVDFDLGDLWATEQKLTLKESRGKVVAAVFRSPGNRRAHTFLQEMDQMVKERAKDGLAGVTLAFLAGAGGPEENAKALRALREDLNGLGVSLPAGYDPDRKGQSLFRSVHATVGTASFIVFNRKGEIAWFLADPRDLDRQLARRVIERLLEEKGAGGGSK